MKGYPLEIDDINAVEDGKTIRCGIEPSNIQDGQFFVESRPDDSGINTKTVPVFQLIEDTRKETEASLMLYHLRTIIRKK
jgi:hypothetical protein